MPRINQDRGNVYVPRRRQHTLAPPKIFGRCNLLTGIGLDEELTIDNGQY